MATPEKRIFKAIVNLDKLSFSDSIMMSIFGKREVIEDSLGTKVTLLVWKGKDYFHGHKD